MLLPNLNEVFLEHCPYSIATSSDGSIISCCSFDGHIEFFKKDLRSRISFALQAEVHNIAVGDGGHVLAVCQRDRLVLFSTATGAAIKEIPHRDWGSYATGACAFSVDGKFLWMVRPASNTTFAIDVVDTLRWSVVDSVEFVMHPQCGFTLVPHPNGRHCAVWGGAGEDGAWLMWARFYQNKLTKIEDILNWPRAPVIHSSGSEMLTVSPAKGEFWRIDFPTFEPIGMLPAAEMFGRTEDGFDVFCAYTESGRGLVSSTAGDIAVIDLWPMKPIANLVVNGSNAHENAQLMQTDDEANDVCDIHMAGNRLLTVHSVEENDRNVFSLKLWDLSSLR